MEAKQLQEELRSLVTIQRLTEKTLKRVGGVDASSRKGVIYAAVVVLDYVTQEPVEQVSAIRPITFPYVPGLLSFREAPAILAAMEQLIDIPDVLIIDGHGLAHPRRFGLACHLGVLLDIPSIGCAKSILVGEHPPLAAQVGSTAALIAEGEIIGQAVRTRQSVKPLYISIGQRVDLESASRIVLACCRGYRLPEPARWAHRLATQAKKAI